MRITLNLATRPFVELRPLYMRLRVAIAALAVLATVLGFGWRALDVKARKAEAQMDVLQTQTDKFRHEREANEARMREPQNAAELARSQFLNNLFVEKGFSWTAVMMDLENVLPAGVQVTSIDPQITPERKVLIRMRVSGERDRAVQLVKNLEGSKRFVAPRLASESLQNQGTTSSAAVDHPAFQLTAGAQASPTAVEFDIVSNYNPLPEKSETEKQKTENREQRTGSKGTGKKKAATGRLPSKPIAAKPHAGTTAGLRATRPPQNEAVTAAQRIAAEHARQAAQKPNSTGGPR
ncbi:MAG: fimbrial assembly protein [Acidobacteriaceae bacterium]